MTICATYESVKVSEVQPPSVLFSRPARVVSSGRSRQNFKATVDAYVEPVSHEILAALNPELIRRRGPRIVELKPMAAGEAGRRFRMMSKPVEWPKDDPDVDYE